MQIVWIGVLVASVALFVFGQRIVAPNLRAAGAPWLWRALRQGDVARFPLPLGLAAGVAQPSMTSWIGAALGLVNSGLVDVVGALWIVIGSVFGLMAMGLLASGFVVGPTLIVVGAAVAALGQLPRRHAQTYRGQAAGMALSGWGVIAVAIAGIGIAFHKLDGSVRFDSIGLGLAGRMILFTTLGAVVTALSRSPGLVILAAVFGASSGAINVTSGWGAVIGAVLGTGWPAVHALRTGTPDSRRVAAGLLIFLSLATAVGMLVLSWTLPWIGNLPGPLADPGFAVACFMGVFLGVAAAVFAPLMTPIGSMLDSHFVDLEQHPGRSTQLDASLVTLPEFALEAYLIELSRLAEVSRRVAQKVMRGDSQSAFRFKEGQAIVVGVTRAIENHTETVPRANLEPHLAMAMYTVPQAARALHDLFQHLSIFPTSGLANEVGANHELGARMQEVQLALLHLVENLDPHLEGVSHDACARELAAVDAHALGLEQWICDQGASPAALIGDPQRLVSRLRLVRTIGHSVVSCAALIEQVRGAIRGFFDDPMLEFEEAQDVALAQEVVAPALPSTPAPPPAGRLLKRR